MREERARLLVEYNPDAQMRICHDTELCHFGDFPTLAEVGRSLGGGTPKAWLVPQLANLSEFCGCKNKITPQQTRELAAIIAQEYFFLKVSEVMLFFYRFKAGEYGRFYGNIDPMVITCALREFLRDRSEAIFRHEDRRRQIMRENETHRRRMLSSAMEQNRAHTPPSGAQSTKAANAGVPKA